MGVGEWATASFGTGVGNQLELGSELQFPHSLGLLYFRLYLFHWVSREFRRIQVDGARTLRAAYLRRTHARELARPQGGWLVQARYVVFQLLPGPDHDKFKNVRAFRSSSTQAGVTTDTG